MAENQHNSKIVLSSGEVLMDLTQDTVVADKLLKGFTAHGKDGAPITGSCEFDADTGDATAGAADLVLGARCAAGMTGCARRRRMTPFRRYAVAGVARGLAAYAATLGRLLRFFAARSARLRANPRECVKKVK